MTTCSNTFIETKGTLIYRKRTDEDENDILEISALILEGSRKNSQPCVEGQKEDTLAAWLREAAEHVEAIEGRLI